MIEWRHSGTAWAFWKRVLDYAKRKCRDSWMFQDRECPHCKVWASEVGGFSTSYDNDLSPLQTMYCGNCGKSSRWHNEGIVAWVIE